MSLLRTAGSGTEASDLAELLRQVKRLELRTERLVNDLAAGSYHSCFKGQGMEFEEVREYSPGDDVRHIDWNVTARSGGRAYIKVFREERDLTVQLLVDISGSMRFGRIPGLSARAKLACAAEAAGIVAVTALRNHDRIGLVTFTDRHELHLPQRKGRHHALRIIRECLGAAPSSRPTSVSRTLGEFDRITRKRSVVFVISDFLASEPDLGSALARCTRRHDLILLRVSDPGEASLPTGRCPLVLRNPEGPETLVLANDRRSRARYEGAYAAQRKAVDSACRNAGCELVDLSTDTSSFTAIQAFFDRRRRRRG